MISRKVFERHCILYSIYFSTVWKTRNLLSLKKYFVKSPTVFILSFVKTLLWRNFCQKSVRVNLLNFHTVFSTHAVEITEFYCLHAMILSQKFRQTNFLRERTLHKIDLTKKFCMAVNFTFFHTVPHCWEKSFIFFLIST